MLNSLKKYSRDPLYRNSIAMMLNSAFGAFFGLLFWIVAARTMQSKGAWDSSEVGRLVLVVVGEAGLTYSIYLHSAGASVGQMINS